MIKEMIIIIVMIVTIVIIRIIMIIIEIINTVIVIIITVVIIIIITLAAASLATRSFSILWWNKRAVASACENTDSISLSMSPMEGEGVRERVGEK